MNLLATMPKGDASTSLTNQRLPIVFALVRFRRSANHFSPQTTFFGLALALVVTFNLYFAPHIERERVAMHFCGSGEPTWYAPKWMVMWGMIAFMAAVRLFIWLARHTRRNLCTAFSWE